MNEKLEMKQINIFFIVFLILTTHSSIAGLMGDINVKAIIIGETNLTITIKTQGKSIILPKDCVEKNTEDNGLIIIKTKCTYDFNLPDSN